MSPNRSRATAPLLQPWRACLTVRNYDVGGGSRKLSFPFFFFFFFLEEDSFDLENSYPTGEWIKMVRLLDRNIYEEITYEGFFFRSVADVTFEIILNIRTLKKTWTITTRDSHLSRTTSSFIRALNDVNNVFSRESRREKIPHIPVKFCCSSPEIPVKRYYQKFTLMIGIACRKLKVTLRFACDIDDEVFELLKFY